MSENLSQSLNNIDISDEELELKIDDDSLDIKLEAEEVELEVAEDINITEEKNSEEVQLEVADMFDTNSNNNSEEVELEIFDDGVDPLQSIMENKNINLSSVLGNFMIRGSDDIADEVYDIEEDFEEVVTLEIDDIDTLKSISETKEEQIAKQEVDAKESELRARDRAIKRANKIRQTVSPEETRAQLSEMLSNSIAEAKAYINNINKAFDLPATKQISKSKNANELYFDLIDSAFKKQYIAELSNQNELLPEVFIDTDIKQTLLSYGGRISESLRTLLESKETFTPSDLIDNEWKLSQLSIKLKESAEMIKNMANSDSSIKSVLSSIRTGLIRKYFQSNLANKKAEYVYVGQIILTEDREEYVCGGCSELSSVETPFYQLGILPFQGKDGNANKIYQAIDIPNANACPHCGKYNILTKDEVDRLSKATIKLHRTLLDDYSKMSSIACSSFALTRYRGGKELLLKTLPVISSEEFDGGKDIFELEEHIIELDTDGAYKRYRELINFFDNSLDFSKAPTGSVLPKTVALGDLGGTIAYNSDIEKNNRLYESEDFKSNLTNIAKILCCYLGVGYKNIKFNTVNSIVMHIRDSKLYNDLSYDNTEMELITKDSSQIVNHIDTLDDVEKAKVIDTLCGIIDYKYSDIVDETTNKVIDSKLADFKSNVVKYYDKIEETAKKAIIKRDKTIRDLKNNIRLYSFIPLANVPVLTDVNAIKYSKELMGFINETADMMILTNLAERYLKFWRTALDRSTGNLFTNLADVNRTNNIEYCVRLLEKTGLMKFITGYKKAQKTKDLMEIFTVLKGMDFDKLSRLDGVKRAYDTNDIFSLMNKIVHCDFMLDKVPDGENQTYVYDTAIYKPIREMITDLLPTALKFVKENGSTETARFHYYLKELFTSEEIDSVDCRRYRTLSLDVLLVRKDNETIIEYLKRLAVTNIKQTNEKLIKHKTEYDDVIAEYSVLLVGCNLPYMFMENNVKKIMEFLTVLDLFYQIIQRDLGTALDVLRIDKDMASKLSKEEGYEIVALDKRKLDATNYLLHSIFLIDAFNYSGDMSTLDVANDDANEELEIGATEAERIKVIISDQDKFIEATKHLPKEVLELINEYYTIGR